MAVVTFAAFFVASSLSGQNPPKDEPALPAVVSDSATGMEYGELDQKVRALNESPCRVTFPYSQVPVTVANFVGGKVKTIKITRVLRLARQKHLPKQQELEKTLRKVWLGQFQSAACRILWAETTFWSIEFVLQFEDGKQGTLITDGVHVALEDHDGNACFFRLLPAAQ